MKNEMEKYQKVFRIILAVIRVMWWACIISLALLAIVLFIVPHIPADRMNMSLALSVGGSSVKFLPSALGIQNEGFMVSYLYFTIITIMAAIMIISGVLRSLIHIMRNAAEGRPFDPANEKHLQKMGVKLIVGGGVLNIISMAHVKTLEKMFSQAISGITYSLDSSYIATGILILCLAFVFRYGAFLQREYDETL